MTIQPLNAVYRRQRPLLRLLPAILTSIALGLTSAHARSQTLEQLPAGVQALATSTSELITEEEIDLSRQPELEAAIPRIDTDDEYYSVIVDDTYIELHSGPGRGYPVFHVVERGELVHLHKQRTDWIKLSDKWHKNSGWARRSDLNQTLGLDGAQLNFGEPSWDDYLARRWEGGVALGDFNGVESLTLNVGYRLTRNLSAEVRVSQSTGQFSDNTLINAAILHQPFPAWRVSPFFMLGAGTITTEPNATLVQTEDRTDTAMLVGAGAYVYLSRRFVMRLEYNNHLILTSREQNEEINEWKLGFNVFF